MATYTDNFSLTEPAYGDKADIGVINQGVTEKVDRQLYKNRAVSAPMYDPTEGNVIGDLRINGTDGLLYKCTGATSGVWDSAKWTLTDLASELENAGSASAISDLTDVDLTSLTDGQMLKWDATAQKWVNVTLSVSTSFASLTDTDITNPSDGQIVRWDATSQKWQNVDMPDASVTKSVTGNPLTFSDGADAPLVECKAEIVATQEGTGTPSNENIRPLRGFSKVYLNHGDTPIYRYGFYIDGNKSNPSDMVSYLADAVGMTPAHMDYTNDRFDYGSWGDVWFIKDCKPCILGQDGTVIKYLNPNDYTKDIDGNSVTIDENLTGANVMIEFPKIWYKVVPDTDNKSASVFVSNIKFDDDYKDYAYIASDGVTHKSHFYMAAYNSSTISGVLRSLSGQTTSKTKSLSGTTEINYAEANGVGWSTEHAGQVMLINFLLMLIGKSTNTQAVFGQGLHTSGSEAVNNSFPTGIHNTKGLFYGTNSGAAATYTNAVKVFGIENWYGFQWRRYRGDILDSGVLKIKLCYGTEDGSTTHNFNTDGTGYRTVTNGAPSGTSGQYISQMTFDDGGMYAKTANISDAGTNKAYCDGYWFNGSDVRFALRGGASYAGSLVGAFSVTRDSAVSYALWSFGAAVSYI